MRGVIRNGVSVEGGRSGVVDGAGVLDMWGMTSIVLSDPEIYQVDLYREGVVAIHVDEPVMHEYRLNKEDVIKLCKVLDITGEDL